MFIDILLLLMWLALLALHGSAFYFHEYVLKEWRQHPHHKWITAKVHRNGTIICIIISVFYTAVSISDLM